MTIHARGGRDSYSLGEAGFGPRFLFASPTAIIRPNGGNVMRNKPTANVSARQDWALSRRQLLQAAVVQAVSLPLLPWLAADEASAAEGPPPPLPPLNRFPRMVQEYFVAQVRAAEAKGLAAKQALQTKARRRGLRPVGAGQDPDVFRTRTRTYAAQSASHGRGRAGRLPDREGDLRQPARLSRDGQSVSAHGPLAARARRRRHLRALDQRQGGEGVPIVRPGTGPHGICVLDLRSRSAKANGCSTSRKI